MAQHGKNETRVQPNSNALKKHIIHARDTCLPIYTVRDLSPSCVLESKRDTSIIISGNQISASITGFDKWSCASGPTLPFPLLQALPVNVPILSVMYNGARPCQTALNEIVVVSSIVPLPLLRQSNLAMYTSI